MQEPQSLTIPEEFQDIYQEIRALAQVGHALLLDHLGGQARYVEYNFPPEWRKTYVTERLEGIDPIARWAQHFDGTKRWSDIDPNDFPTPKNAATRTAQDVMTLAADHGLKFGAVISIRKNGKFSLLSIARQDRELSDSEINRAVNLFNQLVSALLEDMGLTDNEKRALSALGVQGLSFAEAAQTLSASEATVKLWSKTARKKLSAKNTTHAVAIATRRGYI